MKLKGILVVITSLYLGNAFGNYQAYIGLGSGSIDHEKSPLSFQSSSTALGVAYEKNMPNGWTFLPTLEFNLYSLQVKNQNIGYANDLAFLANFQAPQSALGLKIIPKLGVGIARGIFGTEVQSNDVERITEIGYSKYLWQIGFLLPIDKQWELNFRYISANVQTDKKQRSQFSYKGEKYLVEQDIATQAFTSSIANLEITYKF